MSNEFVSEERYIVFKVLDVERYLTQADQEYLSMMKHEIDAGRDCANKPPFKGLIVEADWPEYEPTWKAIEARVNGVQQVPDGSAVQTAARIMNVDLIRQRDELRAKIKAMEQQEPVAIQHRVPFVDLRGECVGYSEWKDGKGLDHWPRRTLYALPGAKGEEK